MVPLIQDEIVEKRKWIDKEDFIDLLALTQSVPGIFAVNIAIFIGYKLRKFKGALAMALGTILPSFFIILAIALFFQQFNMDTYSIGTSYLVIGYIPCVYYHHCRSRRLFLW